jgi:hypothetical protein
MVEMRLALLRKRLSAIVARIDELAPMKSSLPRTVFREQMDLLYAAKRTVLAQINSINKLDPFRYDGGTLCCLESRRI